MASKSPGKSPEFDFGIDFNNIFGDLFSGRYKTVSAFGAMDIYDGEELAVIEVCLPGILKSDIEVAIKNHILTVKANAPKDPEGRKYHSQEIKKQSVERRVEIKGDSYDEDHVASYYDNGILKIVLPKKTPKERTVDIK